MTVKHMIDGLMQATGARTQCHLTELLDVPQGWLCRLQNGKRAGMTVDSLVRLAVMSRTPAALLLEWYCLPEGAVLGRVKFTLWEK